MAERRVYVDDWVLAVMHETDPERARDFIRAECERNPYDEWLSAYRIPEIEPSVWYWRSVPGCPEWCGAGCKAHLIDAKKGRGAFPVIGWNFDIFGHALPDFDRANA